jgi:hypothetical protein
VTNFFRNLLYNSSHGGLSEEHPAVYRSLEETRTLSYSTNWLRSTLVVSAGVMLFGAVSPLQAALTGVDIFKNISYSQTSGAAPTSPVNFFADVEAYMANPGDFTSVSVTYPGPGSPVSLPLVTPTKFGIGPSFATQADMDAAYPFGTYTFTAGPATETAAFNYLLDAYTSDIPALDASTFAALQGMNPSQPFTFNFNAFTPNPNASVGETFLTIFGTSFGGGHPPSTTSATMAANTLAFNTTYNWELDFSDRITATDPSSGVPTLIGFDVRTDGSFTTAPSPEPSSMVPFAMMLLGAGVARLRKKAH